MKHDLLAKLENYPHHLLARRSVFNQPLELLPLPFPVASVASQDLVFTSQNDLSSVDLAFALAAEHWPEEDPDDAWQQAEVALKVLSRSTPLIGTSPSRHVTNPSSVFYFFGGIVGYGGCSPAYKGSWTCGVDPGLVRLMNCFLPLQSMGELMISSYHV